MKLSSNQQTNEEVREGGTNPRREREEEEKWGREEEK